MNILSLWKGEVALPRSVARRQIPEMRRIAEEVATRHGLTLTQLISQKRDRAIAWPRQEAMYEVQRRTTNSTSVIGQFFGGRDHTTVLHAVRAHEGRLIPEGRD